MVHSLFHRSRSLRTFTAAAIGVTLAACNRTQVVQGACAKVNGADVCTWGEMNGKALTAFGATVPMATMKNAPADAPMVWPPKSEAFIALPAEVTAATGFKVLTIYWEPHGHPPGPYLTPHWDFHFYNVSAAEITAMSCADTTKPATLPAGYVLPDVTIPGLGTLPGICVPGMGMHSLLGTEVAQTQPFEKTMVVGWYAKKPIFVEPMLANATLLAGHSFTLDIPVVPGEAADVHQPSNFRADYDSASASYRFVFTNFSGAGGK
jgi:hypothetical protein